MAVQQGFYKFNSPTFGGWVDERYEYNDERPYSRNADDPIYEGDRFVARPVPVSMDKYHEWRAEPSHRPPDYLVDSEGNATHVFDNGKIAAIEFDEKGIPHKMEQQNITQREYDLVNNFDSSDGFDPNEYRERMDVLEKIARTPVSNIVRELPDVVDTPVVDDNDKSIV
ncbi:hypothetical protein J6A31_01005 [bacterium]|nr:hypothetical protein [bacterium]